MKEKILKIIEIYGIENQYTCAIEEMSELIRAICKFKRYNKKEYIKDIIEEMADVQNSINILKIIFDCDEEMINAYIVDKLDRAISNQPKK